MAQRVIVSAVTFRTLRQVCKAAARQQSDLQSAQQGRFASAGLAHKHGPKTHRQGLMQLQDFVHKVCWLLQALLVQHCTCCCLQLPMCLHQFQLCSNLIIAQVRAKQSQSTANVANTCTSGRLQVLLSKACLVITEHCSVRLTDAHGA